MTKEKVNHTDRKDILPGVNAEFSIIRKAGDTIDSFESKLQLDDLDLPPDADVVVEAFRGNARMRFKYGTVGECLAPSTTKLDDIEHSFTPMFAVKVLKEGKILASSGSISPSLGENLLLLKKDEVPDGTVWHLVLDGGPPVLVVNKDCQNVMERFKAPFVQALLLPVILKDVLYSLIEEYVKDDAEPGDWEYKWVRLAERFANGPIPVLDPDDSSLRKDWVNRSVRGFAKLKNVVSMFNTSEEPPRGEVDGHS